MTIAHPGLGALRDMRIRRRRNRVAAIEWFEALYRVYIAAFLGLWAVLLFSDLAGGDALGPEALADVTTHGPALIGLIAAVTIHLGIASGASGGPLSLETPEVDHVLLAPIPRRVALRRPLIQRLRTAGFIGVLSGAIVGQLMGRRIPNSGGLPEWALWGGVAGGSIAIVAVAAAVIVHAAQLPRALPLTASALIVLWQALALQRPSSMVGPFDNIGSLALWTLDGVDLIDAIAPTVTILLAVVATGAVGRLSVESLAARGGLVSQMRFAVTLHDIRTVVLLRRQLTAEQPRRRPWVRIDGTRYDPVIVRGVRGLARTPTRRVVRMVVVAASGGAALVPVWHGTTPFVVVVGGLFFMLGLELLEPLSQQIDHIDATDVMPVERGSIHVRHLIAPAIVAVPFIIVAVVGAVLVPAGDRGGPSVLVALVATTCSMAGGLAGAALNIVAGAPDPVTSATKGLAMPPEVSGMGTIVRAAWPPAVSVVTALSMVAMRTTAQREDVIAATAVRSIIAVGLLLALVTAWVHRRDAIRLWLDALGRSQSMTSHEKGHDIHAHH